MGGISTRVDTDYSYLLKKDVKKEEVVETVKNEEPEVSGDCVVEDFPVDNVDAEEEFFGGPTVQFTDEDDTVGISVGISEEDKSTYTSTEDNFGPLMADGVPAEPLREKQEEPKDLSPLKEEKKKAEKKDTKKKTTTRKKKD